MRLSRALRISAWALVAAGVAAPVARRRMKIPKAAVAATAWSAPIALCVAVPRSRTRDVAMCMLQMWAYVAMYEMPADDPEALERRVRVDYPVTVDRFLGLGELPGVRLQRRFIPGDRGLRGPEKLLVWSHWIWFTVPHGTALYVLLRRRDRFPRAATLIYATFDLGVIVYWLLPTAPPWYAAERGRMGPGAADGELRLRRLMLRYGQEFWGDNWSRLYDGLAGNPLAAMPSLHFATSVMSAHVLSDVGRAEGALGWAYTATLGTALVYLGEHYVVDLLAGLALVEGIRAAAPAVSPVLRGFSRAVQQLEQAAHAP